MAVGSEAAVERGRSSTPRRERLRAMMRDDILAAARRLLHHRGVKGLAMRALGREVGVTAPTLYDYFPSKDAVLDALFAEGVARMAAGLDLEDAAVPPSGERLRTLARGYRAFAIENPDLYLLIFGRVDASYRPGADQLAAVEDLFHALKREIAGAVGRGADEPEALVLAHGLWAMAHGHVTLEIAGFLDDCELAQRAAIFDADIELVLRAIPRPATHPAA